MVKIRYARYVENREEYHDRFVFDPVRGRKVAACRECGAPRQGRFHFYCSPEHKEKWERENVPGGWGEMRQRILERDGHKCINCGASSESLREVAFASISHLTRGSDEWYRAYYKIDFHLSLEVDHIKPVKLYPELEYEESNLRTLCHECHVKLGARPSRKAIKRRRAFGHLRNLSDFVAPPSGGKVSDSEVQ